MNGKKLFLVDFENVANADLGKETDVHDEVIIFMGKTQNRLPPQTMALSRARGNWKFVKLFESGKNALDFFIAFALGQHFAHSPKRIFIILSNDKGFDPLTNQLRKEGVHCYRQAPASHGKGSTQKKSRNKQKVSTPGLQNPSPPQSTSIISPKKLQAVYEKILYNLKNPNASRPKSISKLTTYIENRTLSMESTMEIIRKMKSENIISISGETINYHL